MIMKKFLLLAFVLALSGSLLGYCHHCGRGRGYYGPGYYGYWPYARPAFGFGFGPGYYGYGPRAGFSIGFGF